MGLIEIALFQADLVESVLFQSDQTCQTAQVSHQMYFMCAWICICLQRNVFHTELASHCSLSDFF